MRNNIYVVSFLIRLVIVFGFAVVAAPAPAQTPSELFEQGVYNEETVGDLEQAIEIIVEGGNHVSSARIR